MVKVWQYGRGTLPSRGYHNAEWAVKMKAIGLQPSSTGAPGGSETGQRMSSYIIPGGPFTKAFTELAQSNWHLNLQSAHQPGKKGRKDKSNVHLSDVRTKNVGEAVFAGRLRPVSLGSQSRSQNQPAACDPGGQGTADGCACCGVRTKTAGAEAGQTQTWSPQGLEEQTQGFGCSIVRRNAGTEAQARAAERFKEQAEARGSFVRSCCLKT